MPRLVHDLVGEDACGFVFEVGDGGALGLGGEVVVEDSLGCGSG